MPTRTTRLLGAARRDCPFEASSLAVYSTWQFSLADSGSNLSSFAVSVFSPWHRTSDSIDSPIALAKRGGTAFPIKRYCACALPPNFHSGGNVWIAAHSRGHKRLRPRRGSLIQSYAVLAVTVRAACAVSATNAPCL